MINYCWPIVCFALELLGPLFFLEILIGFGFLGPCTTLPRRSCASLSVWDEMIYFGKDNFLWLSRNITSIVYYLQVSPLSNELTIFRANPKGNVSFGRGGSSVVPSIIDWSNIRRNSIGADFID